MTGVTCLPTSVTRAIIIGLSQIVSLVCPFLVALLWGRAEVLVRCDANSYLALGLADSKTGFSKEDADPTRSARMAMPSKLNVIRYQRGVRVASLFVF